MKINENETITHHQQDGGILGGNCIGIMYGRVFHSSVPADGREELQSIINLQVSLVLFLNSSLKSAPSLQNPMRL